MLEGAVGDRRAQQAAVLHRQIERHEVVALGRDVSGLARDVLAGLAQQPVDQHDRLVDLVFHDLELAMVLVDRARHAVSGAHALEQEGRLRGGARDCGRQRVHLAEIGVELLELGLGLVPGRHQFRVARGGADLQPGGDAGDQRVVLLGVLRRLGADALELAALLGQFAHQPHEIRAHLLDAGANGGAGGRTA